MVVFSLDSTTRAGCVALIVAQDRGGPIVDERPGDPGRTHAERLPSDAVALLAAHGLTPADVDLFAVASGPGLFTGLRVGIAAMQGFALATGKPMAGVSALDALGQLASRDCAPRTRVAAWMDAHRRDVFTALFEVGTGPLFSGERLIEREGATVGDPGDTLERWKLMGGEPAVFAGDGARRYQDAIAQRFPGAIVAPETPLAGAIALIALERARRGEVVGPAGIQPLYVRRPDAELAREHAVADRAVDVGRRD